MKILFIGNSFTFVNDLPAMLTEIAEKDGIALTAGAVYRGGAYLRQFADPAHELGIRLRKQYEAEKWDAVVLQDQSFNPAKDPADHRAAVEKIIADVVKNGEKIYLYQTWAYRDGTEKLNSTGMTYEEMRTALRESYEASAKAVNGVRVPVGDAFALGTEKGIDMYTPDDYHPSPAGTYAAACLFFRYILGKTPTEKAVPDGLDPECAAVLRACAGAF